MNSPKATWCARELREVIHRIGTATATDGESDPADVDRLNEFSVAGAGHLTLEHGRATWCLSSRSWVDSLFGVIADDAVRVLGGESRTRVRACARPECRGLYVDTSRAGTRRGCSMNYCGNRQKKQNLRASTR
ncbi:CGNR zinc finger domain-containing protein [Gordonia paraffinivorans]|uniref:CGNR zinc finger domain-containing protein n=1 Tax=Gordonia paraffinivorans TaxID=175628 RepID=UPI0027E0CA3F|nr:CGNR zinc finger domain-containing protein [Gordonia paraffinivorans]